MTAIAQAMNAANITPDSVKQTYAYFDINDAIEDIQNANLRALIAAGASDTMDFWTTIMANNLAWTAFSVLREKTDITLDEYCEATRPSFTDTAFEGMTANDGTSIKTLAKMLAVGDTIAIEAHAYGVDAMRRFKRKPFDERVTDQKVRTISAEDRAKIEYDVETASGDLKTRDPKAFDAFVNDALQREVEHAIKRRDDNLRMAGAALSMIREANHISEAASFHELPLTMQERIIVSILNGVQTRVEWLRREPKIKLTEYVHIRTEADRFSSTLKDVLKAPKFADA